MKKSILLFVLFITSIVSFSCNGDDDSSSLNELEQKLSGKWYFEEIGFEPNNSFTFNSNKIVRYTYWNGQGSNPYVFEHEDGTWSMNGDILTMTFPEGVELIFVQKVVFIDDNTVKFVEVPGSEHEPYDGTYYRAE